jgi:diguanylate cyclase (GGDEF)-like protein
MVHAERNEEIGMMSSRLMARLLGAVFTVGSTLAIVWTELPHENHRGDRMVLAMAALALALGVVLSIGLVDRARTSCFHVLLAGIQVVITVAFVAVRQPGNDIGLFYLWATPLAALFFRPRHASAHLAWVGALMAVSLVLQGTGAAEAVRIWMLGFGSVVCVGAVVLWAADGWHRREAALYRAAHFDPLTGLANRMEFGRLARQMLDRRAVGGGKVVLFLTDLDRFKTLNDTQGHRTGDEILLALAGALKQVAPLGSSVARLGGDEFAVIVEDVDGYLDQHGVAAAIANTWREPFPTSRTSVAVGVSACMGVACSTPDDSPSSLLRDAEAALLAAKESGPGSTTHFRIEQRRDVERRYAIERALHDAARLGQFRLAFQPVVEIATGRLKAVEVLLRWNHPELGEVSPAEFIQIAEDHGLIVQIGTWVLEHSIAQLGQWLADGTAPGDFRITVNVSGHQLRAELPGIIERLLEAHAVSAEMVMIELTETVIISGGAETNETLQRLRSMGLALVLDDFGTGYSSLSHLQRARFDCVKIDRSFVSGVVEHGTDRSIVSAIIALAEALDIAVVAEGVESKAQADALRGLSCRFGQGYLFDRPLSAAELGERLVRPQLRAVAGTTSLPLGRVASAGGR